MLIVAKKVMMWSLERITSTFPNLANDQCGWFGTDRTEFVFSNDFRWTNMLIQWKYFLLSIEGNTAHLSSPKNHSVTDLCIKKEKSIFLNSKEPIKLVVVYNLTDKGENQMMVIICQTSYGPIARDKQKDVPTLAKCFPILIKFGL